MHPLYELVQGIFLVHKIQSIILSLDLEHWSLPPRLQQFPVLPAH